MKQYLDALQYIMDNGVDRIDRTGVGTRAVFTYQMRFNLKGGFPAVTTKKLAWLAVKSELLWMIEGSCNERRLAEIRYGKPCEELEDKKTIWTANAQADYWKPKARFEGDLGRVYGVQWRNWKRTTPDEVYEAKTKQYYDDNNFDPFTRQWQTDQDYQALEHRIMHTDQLADVIDRIKDKPWDRRHVITAWNPGEINNMALPPCHMIYQFFVANDELSCHMFQRSCDMILGVPFNIASYATLTHMVAQVCDLGVGELVLTLGDAHIYNNHFDATAEQLTRIPCTLPTLKINPDVKDIDGFKMEDLELVDYNPQAAIKADMAV